MDTFEGAKPVHGKIVVSVYKLTHRDSGKFYIGSTGDFYVRRKNHIVELRNGKHPIPEMQELYDESPHFTFELVSVGIDHTDPLVRERAFDQEQALLDMHWGNPLLLNRSRDSRCTKLSEESEAMRIENIRQAHQKTEVREKVTKVNRAIRQSEKAREQQSAISKTLWQNDNHRARMESVWKDPDYLRRQVENQPTSKTVVVAGQLFGSISQASKKLGIARGVIRKRISDSSYPDYALV
jgi:hypothetical protein